MDSAPDTAPDTDRAEPAVAAERLRRLPPFWSVLCRVVAVLVIALAKNREDRFESAGELASSFMAAVKGELSPEIRDRSEDLLAEASQRFKLR